MGRSPTYKSADISDRAFAKFQTAASATCLTQTRAYVGNWWVQLPKIAIDIVTWNSAEYIQTCLSALFSQTCKDFVITIVDNDSQDGTVSIVQSYASHGVRLIQNVSNEGYAPAHNKAIATTDSEFVLNLNPDVVLTPTYLTHMIDAFQQGSDIGSIAGKLLTVSADKFRVDLPSEESAQAYQIDGAGLLIYKNRRQFLRGHGLDGSRHCLEPSLIFGPDGAAPLYRRVMLEDIKIGGEYFDETFRSHKEDVDLAWRAQLFGWRSLYTPHAVAYHIRGFRPGQRIHLASRIKRDAVKNRWLMNIKNELPKLVIQDLPYIVAYELQILGYLIVFERSSLPAIWDFIKLLPHALAHRREIQKRRKRDYHYMRQWFI